MEQFLDFVEDFVETETGDGNVPLSGNPIPAIISLTRELHRISK